MTSHRLAFLRGILRKCLVLLGIVTAGVAIPIEAQERESRSVLLLDRHFSTLSATTVLATAARSVHALANRGLPTGSNFLMRLTRLALVDVPVVGLHGVARHEIAGHGGRVRQFGGDVLEYDLNPPLPYGGGGGSTRFGFEEIAPSELALVAAGGLESAYLDATGLEERWVVEGTAEFQESLQYVYDVHEILRYLRDAEGGVIGRGHDVDDYLFLLRAAAPGGASGDPVTSSTVRKTALVELLNPSFHYALYGVLWRYLVRGEPNVGSPSFGVGSVDVLPRVHVRLTPFGPEYAAGVAASGRERTVGVNLRGGSGPWGRFGGIDLTGNDFFVRERLSVGGRASVWSQFDHLADSVDRFLGGMAVVRALLWHGDRPLAAVAEVGLKSAGYISGEPLAGGPLGRVGVAIEF